MPEKHRLWAPWRGSYVTGAEKKPEGCVFCGKQSQTDGESLIVYRGKHIYIVMNLFPYNNGHIMLIPYRHIADITDFTPEESAEMAHLEQLAVKVLRQVLSCEGYNMGYNIGAAAGAGVASHLHQHIVPRWFGDTNFMPVVADTKVISEHMEVTFKKLKEGFELAEGL